MKCRLHAAAVIAASTFLLSACGESTSPQADANVQSTAPAAPASAAASGNSAVATASMADKLVVNGLASQIPASWMATQPTSTMRIAQFALPPAEGAEAGELAVFYFPTGQGGSHEANVERWTSQFAGDDGKPVTAKVSVEKSGDTELSLVELHGTYARGVGMGPTGDAKPDQSLLVAMVETNVGRITLQMYGPAKTVALHRDGFIKFSKNFRPV